MKEARQWARTNGHEVDEEVLPLPQELPTMSELLSSKKVALPSLDLRSLAERRDCVASDLLLQEVSFAAADRGGRYSHDPRKWTAVGRQLQDIPVTRLSDDVYICSPLVSLLAMARKQGRPALAQLLTELCGNYALDSAIKRGLAIARRCLT